MYNFQDDQQTPFTKSEVEAAVFNGTNSLQEFYRQSSWGKIWLTGQVAGWYTVPFNSGPGCLTAEYEAIGEAVNAGIDVSSYQRLIFLTPYRSACGTGSGSSGGNPTTITLNGDFSLYILTHEFGHNLGLGHAGLITCGVKQIDVYGSCQTSSYGDYINMGHNTFMPHGFYRSWLGWMDGQMQEVTRSDTYTIYQLNDSAETTKLLKIRKEDTQEYYYIDYRVPTAGTFDAMLPQSIGNGAAIRVGRYMQVYHFDSPYTWLIDATPTTGPTSVDQTSLEDGLVFNDDINGISMRQVSHNSLSVTLEVTVPSRTLTSVRIQPQVISMFLSQKEMGLSALAYDQLGKPIWSGVTYEWGMSSANSIGTIGANGNIATFRALRTGHGQLLVTARYNDENIVQSAPVDVYDTVPSSTPHFSLEDIKAVLQLYGTNDSRYYPDDRINVMDVGYIIRWLTP